MSSAGTTVKQPSTRERLLQVAAELFIANGFSSTPLSEIAGRLDVKKPSLYYHFESKDAVLLALVSPLLDKTDEFLTEAEAAPRLEPKQYLAQFAEVLESDTQAVAVIASDPQVWLRASIQPRLESQQRRMMALLLDPDADAESVFRARTAIYTLQSTLFLEYHRRYRNGAARVPQESLLPLIITISTEVLERRLES